MLGQTERAGESKTVYSPIFFMEIVTILCLVQTKSIFACGEHNLVESNRSTKGTGVRMGDSLPYMIHPDTCRLVELHSPPVTLGI